LDRPEPFFLVALLDLYFTEFNLPLPSAVTDARIAINGSCVTTATGNQPICECAKLMTLPDKTFRSDFIQDLYVYTRRGNAV
jgi:hypothetical protein